MFVLVQTFSFNIFKVQCRERQLNRQTCLFNTMLPNIVNLCHHSPSLYSNLYTHLSSSLVPRHRPAVERDALWVMGFIVRSLFGIVVLMQTNPGPLFSRHCAFLPITTWGLGSLISEYRIGRMGLMRHPKFFMLLASTSLFGKEFTYCKGKEPHSLTQILFITR